MYYPIFRGRLNELLALRELATLSFEKKFCPVIEPVKDALSPLVKTIEELNKSGITPLIIVNPTVGDFNKNSIDIQKSLSTHKIKYIPMIVINQSMNDIVPLLPQQGDYAFLIKGGLDQAIIEHSKKSSYNFISYDTSPNLINKVENVVMFGDFFKKQKRNADYPRESVFSALHTYYDTNNPEIKGFADYSVVGEEYTETGGPAYVVTIHASYINTDKFDEAYIRHYSSTDDKTPANPGKKFLEALDLLIDDYKNKKVDFAVTEGMKQFEKIHQNQHFPGLGQLKKMSILHHTETINEYLLNR